MTRFVHIVWAPTGPLAAYTNPELAHAHARTMVGVDVSSVPVSKSLPAIVLEDLGTDYDDEQDTPVDVVVEDLDGD